jgi:pyridinium-3,5-biscarboxylic acid mononucleotide sulfurtransferase
MTQITPLEQIVADYPSVLIGYSGGVDSTLLAVVARRTLGRDRTVAAMGMSASLAESQRQQAAGIARTFDLDLVELATDELDDPEYAANPTNRCYFCKRTLWRHLGTLARNRGMAVVADGTNLDDRHDHRPGRGAAEEAGIRSPLMEAGYTKAIIRDEARRLGIPVWDAPASPCLSSRVMYGLSITPERLQQVEAGEKLLRELGVTGDLRVRHRDGEARLEVTPGEFPAIRRHREEIAEQFLALGFRRITLDLNGYRRGSLLAAGEPPLELLAERV